MISFSNVSSIGKVSKDRVLEKISPEMIHAYYLGAYGFRKLNKKFSSPFRRDSNPSAEVKISKNGNLIFNDYGGKQGLDCFAIVQELYHLDFNGALHKIAADFGITGNQTGIDLRQIQWAKGLDKTVREETSIQFELLDWPAEALQYWKQYYIIKEELEKDEDVFAIGELCINDCWLTNSKNKSQFVYLMQDVATSKIYSKIYRPFYKNKWYSNCPNHIPFGHNSLPFVSDTLLITKSYKDMKVLRKFHPDTCATQNESIEGVKFLLEHFSGKYAKYIVWYDADETGLKVAADLRDIVSKTVTTPPSIAHLAKDPAEFIAYYGPITLRELTLQHLK